MPTARPAGGSRLPVVLWASFSLFILYGGTIPFDFSIAPAAAVQRLVHLPINPLISPDTGRRVSIPDLVQNVALFVPFGALGVVALQRRRSRSAAIAWSVVLAALVSGTVEALQLFEPDRTASVADLCWNVAGGAVGAVAIVALVSVARASLIRLDERGLVAVPAFYPLVLASLLLLLAAWEPFDFTLDVGSLLGKIHALRVDPWQLGTFRDEGVELLRYATFGLALSMWLRQLGVRGAAWMGAGAAAAVACSLEASQWIVASRMPGLEDALVHAGGGAIGAALSNGWPHGRGRRFWWSVTWAATTLGAAFQLLAPFAWTSAYRPMQWMPFANYYERTTLQTLSHAFELVLIYVPLGFVSAAAFDGWLAFAAAAAAAASTAVSLEYLQGWTPGRYGDVTDAIVSVGGALAGCLAVSVGRQIVREWLDLRRLEADRSSA